MRTWFSRLTCALALIIPAGVASAQPVEVKGYFMAGSVNFTAADSFDAVMGSSSGTMLGGGAEVGLPFGGLYVGVAAWRYKEDGERVFVSGSEVFPLGIPLTVQVTPIEITGGWRFRNLSRRFIPYAGAGWSSYGYKETSSFAEDIENVDERHTGFHILAGADVRLTTWLGVGGEVVWSSVPDALGTGGASEAFGETDLGGTSFRLRVNIGR
jgi:hypothetical protein